MSGPLLSRKTFDAPPPAPVRIVHLGLGAFHRAHQAWYTQHADPKGEWGIAAFTGRRPDAALTLAAQDGLYTLIERADSGDSFEVITSIVEANDGADVARLLELVAAPSTALVTLTITEAAYHLGADGELDAGDPAVAADIKLLAARTAAGGPFVNDDEMNDDDVNDDGGESRRWARTATGRLVQALDARRRSGAGPIAIVSCDNLAHNGAAARTAVQGLAAAADPELTAWIDENVSFVSTSVDRITPRTTDAELELVAASSGLRDAAPVVTEPFRNWVLSGDFPAGRPEWERAGAVFVDDIEPFENRKLWLLNGAHSLLAYAGQLRGHSTVAQALADPDCRAWMTAFWDEAQDDLPVAGLGIPDYREALLKRFSNSRITHYLAQIAMDGSSKLRMRAFPVLKAELTAGRSGEAAARMIGSWIAFLRASRAAGTAVEDTKTAELEAALALPAGEDIGGLLELLDPTLAANVEVRNRVQKLAERLSNAVPGPAAP
ncbi:mannitol dehydrogenase family protein [Paeniglutamicibacter antarcticus]|uniref:Mannitol-1-phosphate 5-dehydrogenase n=1 Tax=Arthrobacter terrae TaxID=2935737 RepID=A0A931CV88_9MICC|nr:mannitol dehydrogenase family protein [Arthrobacter terrae]MBG0741586.1 mannitol dehydrogenase family protein [Arthrobacter terrae]